MTVKLISITPDAEKTSEIMVVFLAKMFEENENFVKIGEL